jgi:hypothetical protein
VPDFPPEAVIPKVQPSSLGTTKAEALLPATASAMILECIWGFEAGEERVKLL